MEFNLDEKLSEQQEKNNFRRTENINLNQHLIRNSVYIIELIMRRIEFKLMWFRPEY